MYGDEKLQELVAACDEYTWEFFRVLALCHTVVSVESPDGTVSSICYIVMYSSSSLTREFIVEMK